MGAGMRKCRVPGQQIKIMVIPLLGMCVWLCKGVHMCTCAHVRVLVLMCVRVCVHINVALVRVACACACACPCACACTRVHANI